jgi:hypothetical protein
MLQDGAVILALNRHDRRANLAQTDTVTPPGAVQHESLRRFSTTLGLNDERRAEQMRIGQDAPYLEFLAKHD